MSYGSSSGKRPSGGGIAGLIVAVLVVLFGGIIAFDSFDSTDAEQIGVVRNGGPLDDRKPFQVINAGSGITWTGLFSTTRMYPGTPRPYTITDDNATDDKLGSNAVALPTKDGVTLGVEGTIYTTLTANAEKLKEFDGSYGARKFVGNDGVARFPSDGDDGWNTFQDAVVQPIVNNTLRVKFTGFECVQLLTSCALVRAQPANQTKPTDTSVVPNTAGEANVTNLDALQTAVEDALKTELGGIFDTIQVRLTGFKLPVKAQESIDKTLAAWGDANTAIANATANEAKQRGYNACPTCAEIDKINALPDGLTTYAPGAGYATTGK